MSDTGGNVEPQVVSDGVTVWVHGPHGTIARFGRLGIDVHTYDTTGCLHCTHEPTDSWAKWNEFVEAVAIHYNVDIGDEHRPSRVVPPWAHSGRKP